MMNMFGFQGLILLSPEQRARRTEMRKQAVERRLAQVVSWDQDTKWAPELNIRAESYMRHRQARLRREYFHEMPRDQKSLVLGRSIT